MFCLKAIPTILVCLAVLFLVVGSGKSKKYSREFNENGKHFDKVVRETYDPDFRSLQRPFRIAKLNLVWSKAQNRLTEPKLKSLYMELKIHDKEEIAWKQLASQHKDKEGIKENELRRKLIGIMSTYHLLEHFEDTNDKEKVKPYKKFHDPTERHLNKGLFHDKKLAILWEKAELSGFTAEEMESLKQEFQNHQDKVDIYYSLLENLGVKPDNTKYLNAINEDELEVFNAISNSPNENEVETPDMSLKRYESQINQVRDHHHGIKDHFDRLERLVSSGPHSQDFIEPKVQGLWKVAQANNFTNHELASIKTELHHFEARLLKLRHMHAEHALQKQKYRNEKHRDKSNRFEDMEDTIRKQTRKVEKIQDTIEKTIFKHVEL